jgi:hypothetical protein
LTLPLTVGPGAISVAVTLGRNFPSTPQPFVVRRDLRRRGALIVCVLTYFCFDVRGAAAAHAGRDRPGGGDAPFRVHPAVHRRADHVERASTRRSGFRSRAGDGKRAFCYNHRLSRSSFAAPCSVGARPQDTPV